MKDIDIIIYKDILDIESKEKEINNRIHLEVPDYLEHTIYNKSVEDKNKKEPRRVIIIDL
jgi:hypothetical protein